MSITPENLPADVLEAIGRGETIEAIKLLREHTGLGLTEAKYLVDQYRLGSFQSLTPDAVDTDMPADVRAALARGQKIEAIKLLRGHTGLGLKEAKDWIEARPVARDSTAAPAGAPASASWWWLIAVILAAVAAFALLRGPGAEAPL